MTRNNRRTDSEIRRRTDSEHRRRTDSELKRRTDSAFPYIFMFVSLYVDTDGKKELLHTEYQVTV